MSMPENQLGRPSTSTIERSRITSSLKAILETVNENIDKLETIRNVLFAWPVPVVEDKIVTDTCATEQLDNIAKQLARLDDLVSHIADEI